MKKFLILFTLITYSAAGCAGSNRLTEAERMSIQFNKDREQCIQSMDKDLSSEGLGKILQECDKKNYKYHQAEVKDSQVKYNNLTTAERILLSLILIPVGAAILILSAAPGGSGGGGLGGFGR
jgi:hypothetical protein